MEPTKFEIAIALIDEKNKEDINVTTSHGLIFSKEYLYSQRMSKKLLQFCPNASQELQIACRAQHICRWKIDRSEFNMDRVGYLTWRETLKKMHAEITEGILLQVGFDATFIKRVSFLIHKKMIKKDEESQVIEDVICLVFLEYYFEEFILKHDDQKLIPIIQKTWAKMSKKGQDHAMQISFSKKASVLLSQALQS